MFVDDESKLLAALQRSLRGRAAEWDMTFNPDSRSALISYIANPFDVVVSDLAMPTLDGLSMIIAMKDKSAYPTAYIMLTGTADLNDAVDAINRARVFRFFTKPCAAELLAEGIAAALALAAPKADADPGKDLSEAIGLAALNRLVLGVIVTDPRGRVLLTNQAGGVMLSERDGLSMSNGEVLRASESAESRALLDMIARVCAAGIEDDAPCGIALSRPSQKRPLIALVTALAADAQNPRAAIYVNDGERSQLPDADEIARLFGLSRSEAALTHALAGGARLEDAAAQAGLTLSTARTYLKQVFAKTDTSRQAELVKLILTAPGIA